jgi:hypothetical protein
MDMVVFCWLLLCREEHGPPESPVKAWELNVLAAHRGHGIYVTLA